MSTIKSYTDIEQSKKLAEILPRESADMHFINDKHAGCVPYLEIANGSNPWLKGTDISPCWSLAALLCVIPGGQVNRMADSNKWEASSWGEEDFEPEYYVEDYDNPVDACYDMILKLHESNLL